MTVQFHQQHGCRVPGKAGLAEIFHRPDGEVVQKLQRGGNDPVGNDGGHRFGGLFQGFEDGHHGLAMSRQRDQLENDF